MNNRHSQLVLISKKVEKANDQINQVISKLGWTRKELQEWRNQQKKLVICPFDKRHYVSSRNMKEHYRRCLLKSRGTKVAKLKMLNIENLKSAKSEPNMEGYKNRIDTMTAVQQPGYIEELEAIPTIAEKCQAYDQMIQRSNLLRKDHHHTNLVLSDEIDRQVLAKKKSQLQQQQQQQQQQSKKSKKYRVKMKINTPTEIQRELIQAYMQQYK
ncbi:hypothetical protein MFLAVUS_005611 [Mucor flavus]|uniref:CHHC U11-48K-type domain-containing protein n=1 Tax=Mucor flavus TaxID=439312 RepID=A0ABP9YZ83_9FUNG